MALTLKIFSRAEGAARFMGQHELEGARVTIGRSVECTLQLPDPERKLSRVHVEFLGTGDGYRLKVASAHSSVVVNGRDYPPGSEVTLRVGDALSMDVYDLDIVSVGASHAEPMQVAPVDAPAMHREEVAVAPPAALLRSVGSGARLAKRLGIAMAAIAGVMLLLAFWPHSAGRIDDLAYMVKPGGRVDFKGVHKGERFVLVRTRGEDGEGAWDYFVGPPTDRIRATATDKKGLSEIMALDTGFRMTLGLAEGKRFEYRLYGPDRGFLSGSVLYRDKGRWLHGMLKAEAFAGYGELVGVTDITEKVERRKVSSHVGTRDLVFHALATSLISTARADTESEDDHGFHDLTQGDKKAVIGDAAIVGLEVQRKGQKDVKERNDMVGSANRALTGSTGAQANFLLDEAAKTLEKKRTKMKERFVGQAVDVAADISPVVKDVQDAYKSGTGHDVDTDDAAKASSGPGTWSPLGGSGAAPAAHSDAPGLVSAGFRFVKKAVEHPEMLVAYVQAKIKGRVDTSGVPDVTPSPAPTLPQEPRDPNYIGPHVREKAFMKAQEAARRCGRAKDFECAEAAIADLRKYARHGDFFEETRDAEVIKSVTDEVAAERREITLAALKKEEEARRSLQAEDRKSAEKEAEAKRIATQVTPDLPGAATAKAKPRETQDPDAARSDEFIEAQEKRRLKAQADRIDLLDKAATEEDKDRQASLRRRYDALTKAEEEEQAASRRRFERASQGQSDTQGQVTRSQASAYPSSQPARQEQIAPRIPVDRPNNTPQVNERVASGPTKKFVARGVDINASAGSACAGANSKMQAQLKNACKYDGGIKTQSTEGCKSDRFNESSKPYFAEQTTIYYCNR